MYTVYVLKSTKDGKRYTGFTNNLPRRLNEHNTGKTISTRLRRPFVLIYQEQFATKELAEAREKYFKSGVGREELDKLLFGAVPKW